MFAAPKEPVKLADLLAGGPIILAFYPFAFSSTCTSEVTRFARDHDLYRGLGVRIFGVAVDSPYVAREFANTCGADFPILSDFNKEAVHAFDVFRPDHSGLLGTSERAVFVIDREGTVRYAWQGAHPGLEPPYEEVEAAARGLAA